MQDDPYLGLDPRQLQQLTPTQLCSLVGGIVKESWHGMARPSQLPPDNRLWLVNYYQAGRGAGKLLDLRTALLTQNRGWITMGDVRVGDRVFDEFGDACSVTFVSDIEFDSRMFRVSFSDGSSVIACEDHQWLVSSARERKQRARGKPAPARVRTTRELLDGLHSGGRGDLNWSIPVCEALDFGEGRRLLVDPYFLGVWLGSGSDSVNKISLGGRSVAEIISGIPYGFDQFDYFDDSDCVEAAFPMMVWDGMREYGLVGCKHIPEDYKRASISSRLKLLAGIIDTIGFVSKDSRCEIGCNDERLAEDIRELVLGLGIKATMKSRAEKTSYRVCFSIYDSMLIPLRVSFKSGRVVAPGKGYKRQRRRMIVGVDPVDSVPSRCISVDSPNNTYLVGMELIVTHNTRAASEWASGVALSYPNIRVAVVAPTFGSAWDVVIAGESGILSIVPPQLISSKNRTNGLLRLVNGSSFSVYSNEKPEKLRGPQHHIAVLDEPGSMKDGEDIWFHLNAGLRLKHESFQNSIFVSGTPRNTPFIEMLLEGAEESPDKYVLQTGSTMDNRANLADGFVEVMQQQYGGTSLGLQELEGKLVKNVDGALLRMEDIDLFRVKEAPSRESWERVVVSVDPALSTEKRADLTGIIVLCLVEGHVYVLGDYSVKASARDWGERVVGLAGEFGAEIVVETNLAWPLLRDTLKSVPGSESVVIRKVKAQNIKKERAQPVSALYKNGFVHHVGVLEDLEKQWCSFLFHDRGSGSPDRIDACVWGVTSLKLRGSPGRIGVYRPDHSSRSRDAGGGFGHSRFADDITR